jgi:glycosyltransferase involved in cell wall biosynthesis
VFLSHSFLLAPCSLLLLMRIAHFSTVDAIGGAAKATLRLHRAWQARGAESWLVVRDKTVDDSSIIAADQPWLATKGFQLLRSMPGFWPPKTKFTFDHDQERGVSLSRALRQLPEQLDLLCIHWTNRFLTKRGIRALYERYRVPLLYVLWDQEPVTGGCHYSFGCEGYRNQCGNCPLLLSPGPNDLSHQVWQRKKRYLSDLPITMIAPTSWCRDKVRESSLFGQHRVELIPVPLDEQTFVPSDLPTARAALKLPLDKKIILFGASYLFEERKGFAQLIEALRELRKLWTAQGQAVDDLHLAVIGSHGETLGSQLPFPATMLGLQKTDAELVRTYQAADLFVCPSLEDAGPMMIPEAMLCGTPVVAFEMGGAPDLICNGVNGQLAPLRDTAALAQAMATILTHPEPSRLSINARAAAIERHAADRVCTQYAELARELCQK